MKIHSLIVPLSAAFVAVLLSPPGLAAATPLEARRDTSAAVTATVRSGDTAWALSLRLCGRGDLHSRLTIRSPQGTLRVDHDRIWPGDRVSGSCLGRPVAAPRPVIQAGAGGIRVWVHPVPGAVCVSGWGAPRRHGPHKGIDLPRRSGTPIRSAAAGTVTLSRWGNGAGWYMVVDHGRYNTVYMHMVRRSPLPVGTKVAAGRVIGFVGTTGDSSGPHLHIEVHDGAWHPINPAPFLRSHGVPIRGC